MQRIHLNKKSRKGNNYGNIDVVKCNNIWIILTINCNLHEMGWCVLKNCMV